MFDLRLIQPQFDSELNEVIVELEHLRRLVLSGNTPAPIFFQLKEIFHLLESLGSARIEGNHTTLADYIETKVSPDPSSPEEDIQEIRNIEQALAYIDNVVTEDYEITHLFIRELHQLSVSALSVEREGDKTPGNYRSGNVKIAGATHTPPDFTQVQSLMDELVLFINTSDKPIYDLMKVALAHHRFAWIHPFGNGNGRVVRLLTYALLLKFGFRVKDSGRVLNPTAVFCNDRDKYYEMLSKADTGQDQGLESWCTYALVGIKHELTKVDKLADFGYLLEHILLPAVHRLKDRSLLSEIEAKILSNGISKGEFKVSDLDSVFPTLNSRQLAYQIKKLNDARLIMPKSEGARTYIVNFTHSILIRGVMDALKENGFTSSL